MRLALFLSLLLAAGPRGGEPPAGGEKPPAMRIVFLGDSITDGHTYPQLVRQALAEAGKPVPVCINAGVGGDTARGMLGRLDRDVLAHRPGVVLVSAGVNDALRKVPAAEYEADVAAIVDRLRGRGVSVRLLAVSTLGPRHAAAEQRVDEYNAALHRLAARHALRLGDVHRLMREARAAGQAVLEADEVHPDFAGQRLLARAALDALGHPDVAVPAELKVRLLPGVIPHWRLRAAPGNEPLDETSIVKLAPNGGWKGYSLPQAGPAPTWWLEHERQRGFALELGKAVGEGKRFQGIADILSASPRTVYFNTGAHVEAIWLNGKRVYQGADWTGWHAGKERIAAVLQPGSNRVVIETGDAFFLSVTEDRDW